MKANESPIHVAVIGCGLRATAYFRNFPVEIRSRVFLGAVADPSETNRRFFIERFGTRSTVEYADAEDLLRGPKLNAIIIASPNHCHARQLIAAFAWNVPILMEKPVGISIAECREIWAAYLASARPSVTVGFVLRYTPFYRRVFEITGSGVLGQILQVDADELLGAVQTSVFFREGWRLSDTYSGGFLVEKCCHDFDVLAAIAGSPARRVYAMAARSHFIPRPQAEQHLRFDSSVTRQSALDYSDLHIKRYFESISNESVYSHRGDVDDHQSALVEYENGVLTAFTVTFGQPRQTRRIRIMGSNGSLEGDIQRGVIEYEIGHPHKDHWKRTSEAIECDASGHNGGDSQINEAFWGAVLGIRTEIRAGLEDGIEAVITAICAEQSKKTMETVNIQKARNAVFGHASVTDSVFDHYSQDLAYSP